MILKKIKKIFIIYLILGIVFIYVGCSKKGSSIYQMSVGNPLGKAIQIEIVGLGTQLDDKGQFITSAILNLYVSNIGAEAIDLSKDIMIKVRQGDTDIMLTTNTLIEGRMFKPKQTGNYEVSFSLNTKQDISVNVEVDRQKVGFIITATYPAKISAKKFTE